MVTYDSSLWLTTIYFAWLSLMISVICQSSHHVESEYRLLEGTTINNHRERERGGGEKGKGRECWETRWRREAEFTRVRATPYHYKEGRLDESSPFYTFTHLLSCSLVHFYRFLLPIYLPLFHCFLTRFYLVSIATDVDSISRRSVISRCNSQSFFSSPSPLSSSLKPLPNPLLLHSSMDCPMTRRESSERLQVSYLILVLINDVWN